jgi:hypothetical protein
MHQPSGFRDRQYPDHVCLLKKSLYGLKQSPCVWYHGFTDYVAKLGFSHSISDHSLFIYHHGIIYFLKLKKYLYIHVRSAQTPKQKSFIVDDVF